MEEIWKDIEGFDGVYQISNFGKVKSFKRNKKDGSILIGGKDSDGYHQVTLCKNRIQYTKKSHSLVARHFINNPENKPTVNHIDSNRLNNVVTNLEWATIKEQNNHAVKYGVSKGFVGENNPKCKLTGEQVNCIRETYNNITISYAELGRKYNVDYKTISSICKNKTWIKDNS